MLSTQDVELDDTSLTGGGQHIEVPAGAMFVRITITGVVARSDATDPGPSAVGFAELGLGEHTEVVDLADRRHERRRRTTPLAIVLTRLRTDPLNSWRSDPEPQDRSRASRLAPIATSRYVSRCVAMTAASDDVLNRLAGVATATSNRRLTGDPQSTGAACDRRRSDDGMDLTVLQRRSARR